METTYQSWEKRRRARNAGRHTPARGRGGKAELGARERRRLAQLLVCIVLFLCVFFGKGIFPAQLNALRQGIGHVLRTDTDFRAVFSDLGASLTEGVPVIDTLGTLWVEVFGGTSPSQAATVGTAPLYAAERKYLASATAAETGAFHLMRVAPPVETVAPPIAVPAPPPPPAATPMPTAAPATVPAVEHIAYDGLALPANATMDKYRLDLAQTATPVLGRVSSGFGWREHPVDGGEKFHNGVDLAVDVGTPVCAFADGIVDYIGENPAVYGQYLQISHAGGVRTFYAHCSKLCVQKGQTVKRGEKVAESGATGNATGPHLHFELKRNGVLLNPLYYINTQ